MLHGIGLLMTALSSADLVGDDVVEILPVHPRRWTLSCDILKVMGNPISTCEDMLSPSNNVRLNFAMIISVVLKYF